ncbi:putative permease [Sporotomaculum syntrophicum]|uniref:Permease n=1 Tax=Sporotomaculum syntrophicum TaxID=182264 RepID=A0A9D2WNS8_9FIRM|nr:efflux transporter SaoE [Sporotomaculum syntrophicum]KAF1084171.1 putative permease [Sporotomaculum syntrophicum]
MIAELLNRIIFLAFDILNGASVWLVASFILAGLLHNVLSPDKLQRMLGNTKTSSIIKATLSGMLLPMCSCGVIPLALGLYYSGAYLGPTLAFMTATPIINPAAVLLAYGFLGPQIATIYLATGFVIPLFIGLTGNKLAGPELHAPGIDTEINLVELESGGGDSLAQKLRSGLEWGFLDMGVSVSKYVCLGMLLAGAIIALVPPSFIQQYLGNPGMLSLVSIALLGSIMYVCAVGHIPFIAALVASGAAPGLAITFLLTGAATNLPELISIYKLIGRRAVAIYSVVLIGASLLIGYLTNMLLTDFVPLFDLSKVRDTVGIANKFIFSTPAALEYLCSVIVVGLGIYSVWPRLKLYLAERMA